MAAFTSPRSPLRSLGPRARSPGCGRARAARSSRRSARGSGPGWLFIDMERIPNGLESVLVELQAVASYVITSVVLFTSATA